MFSLIWSFGGLLDEQDRKKFSELLLSLTTALPDYDQEISVFDYYVDESGEWDPWQSRLVLSQRFRATLLNNYLWEIKPNRYRHTRSQVAR